MAVTTIQSNNKLITFTREINREFVRNNLFSPYMGEGLDAIIRIRQDHKGGGEQINIPLVTKARQPAYWPAPKSVSTTTECAYGLTGGDTLSSPRNPKTSRTPPTSSEKQSRFCRIAVRKSSVTN